MVLLKRNYRIAISLLACLFLLAGVPAAEAANAVGSITHLSGPLLAKKPDGVAKSLAKDSSVEQGDLLITEKRTYARVKFIDQSEVTLRPDTQFKVESFSYDPYKPKEDKAVMNLVKGGLRAVTGQIGKRDNPDSYSMKTPSATIGIRGTIFEVKICADNCGSLPNGLYFFVPEGNITVTNNTGTQGIGVGQYAYVRDLQTKPVILPANPGINFVLPENIQSKGTSGGCIVR